MPSILIVDDEANIRGSLVGALGREGYQADEAGSLEQARVKLREAYDFLLLDVWLPDGSGLDLLAEVATSAPETIAIVMSGHATIDVAVRATRLGAYDFMEKPLSLEHLLVALRNAGAARALQAENRRLQTAWPFPIIGRSPALTRLMREVEQAGSSSARVLIQGENGTGKELVARALHASGTRGEQPFVAVNCSAIPEELIESELFGHERGAFTGATQARRGRFEEAHLGTLFLDEVGELSPRAQTKLLRVLQEAELSRVGGNRAIKVDVRVIAATNVDLRERVASGRFREDLFFRLAVIPITVPPLRDRVEDIGPLVEHFAAAIAHETGRKRRPFDAEAIALLKTHAFPGNVRELRNLVERLVIMTPGAAIGVEQVREALPRSASAPLLPARLGDAVQEFERAQIEAAIRATGGNMAQAASRLGLERSHLYKKLRKLGLKPDA
jgi:two-component system nitrogen regulation response regulator NtrX